MFCRKRRRFVGREIYPEGAACTATGLPCRLRSSVYVRAMHRGHCQPLPSRSRLKYSSSHSGYGSRIRRQKDFPVPFPRRSGEELGTTMTHVTRSSSPFVHGPFYIRQARGPMSRGVCVLRTRGHKDSKAPGTAHVPTDETASSPPKRLQFILSKYRKSEQSVDAGEAGDSESPEGSPPHDAFAHDKDNQKAPVRTYRGVPIVPSSRTQIDSVDNIAEASGQLLSRAANEGLLRRVVTSRLQNKGESIEEKKSRLFDKDPVTGDEKQKK